MPFLSLLLSSCAGSPAPAPAPAASPVPAPAGEAPQARPTTSTTSDEHVSPVSDAPPATDGGDARGDPLASDTDAGSAYGPKTSGPGTLDPVLIQDVLRQNTRRIRRCWVDALAKDPNASARIVISFVITETGAVERPSVETGSKLPELDRCVAAAFVGVKFPRPTGGSVTVKIPFVFTKAG